MRKRRTDYTIDTGSFADISFLLLIFFMVVTTFNQQHQIAMILPPKQNEDVKGAIVKDRLLKIFLNKENQILYQDKIYDKLNDLDLTHGIQRITGHQKPGIVKIIIHPETKYNSYLNLLSSIKAAKEKIRQEIANSTMNKDFEDLNSIQKKEINARLRYRIVEQETKSL